MHDEDTTYGDGLTEPLAHSIVRNLPDIVSIVDADGAVRYVNEAAMSVLASDGRLLPGQRAYDPVHPDDLPIVLGHQQWLLGAPGRTTSSVARVARGDGGWIHLMTHGVNLLDDPQIQGLLFVSRDVDEQARAQRELLHALAAQRVVAEIGLQALVSKDFAGLLDDALRQIAQLLGTSWVTLHSVNEQGEIQVWHMLGPDPLPPGYTYATGTPTQVVCTLALRRPTLLSELLLEPTFALGKEAEAIGLVDSLNVLLEGPNGPRGVLSVHSEVPREFDAGDAQFLQGVANVLAGAVLREDRERATVTRALHDDLTGLATRSLLVDRVGQALRRSERAEVPLALLMIDLDRFKQVNDSFGHAAGDAVLRQVAERLVACVRAADTVARYGGDEFVVLCDELKHHLPVAQVAARIRRACEEPFVLPGGRITTLSASVGIGWSTDSGSEPAALIAAADEAMYRDKKARRLP